MSDKPPARPDVARADTHLREIFAFDPPQTLEEFIAEVRRAMDRFGDVEPRRDDPRVTVTPVDIDGLAGEWVCAAGADSTRRILHIHGGGVYAGSLHSHRPLVSELAVQSGCAVLHVSYRLAPEHAFPAAHEDCRKAFDWMRRVGPGGAASAVKAFIVGDSAGGNLVMATTAWVLELGDAPPDRIALIGPCLDSTPNPNRPDRTSDVVVNAEAVAAIMLYIGEATARDDPRVSTLFLPDSILASFPPTLIQVGTGEYLLPDAQALAARLAGLNRRAVLSLWPDMPHIWHAFVGHLPEAKAALGEIAAFLAA